jgi:MFS family permease
VAPAGAEAEAFTWLTTAGAAGTAVGAVAAGQLADAGGPALLIPCAGAALAALAARWLSAEARM